MSQWLSKQSENGYVSLSQLNSTERLLSCQPLVSLLDQTSREVALLKNWARNGPELIFISVEKLPRMDSNHE